MSPREEIVFVVDDDARVREAIGELLDLWDGEPRRSPPPRTMWPMRSLISLRA